MNSVTKLFAIVAPFVIGCASATNVTRPESFEKHRQIETISDSTWSIDLPSDWVRERSLTLPIVADRLPQVLARNTETDASLVINTITLNSNENAGFSMFVENAAPFAGGVVIYSASFLIGQTRGVITMTLFEKTNVIAIQLTTTKNRTGFLISCGGTLSESSTVIDKCMTVIGTFNIK